MRLSWERLLGWLLCKLLEGGPGRSLKKAAFFNRFCKNDEPRRRRSGGGGGSCWRADTTMGPPLRARHTVPRALLPGRCSWEAQLGGSLLGGSFLGDAPVKSSWEAPCWEAPA